MKRNETNSPSSILSSHRTPHGESAPGQLGQHSNSSVEHFISTPEVKVSYQKKGDYHFHTALSPLTRLFDQKQ
jgi:hypothetical protein